MIAPPFYISAQAINKIAEISALIERHNIVLDGDKDLRLRRANRIKTIHSSLAIEGNTLSEDEVKDIINGKQIVAPIRQIQEVKNAIRIYDEYPKLNPLSEKDLKYAHSVMMQALCDDAGKYRSGGVGVFGDKGLVHMAPPAQRVPELMGDLFEWLKKSKDHLLIRSCVFHYEFEFIHPFSDGNGRTGRLWQSFIENKVPNKLPNKIPNKSETTILELLGENPHYTRIQLAEKSGLSESGVKKIINRMKSEGWIERVGSNKTGYWVINYKPE